MIIKYELDALDIAKILAKHFGLELKNVHVETRKREDLYEDLHDACVYEAFATVVTTFKDVNSDA